MMFHEPKNKQEIVVGDVLKFVGGDVNLAGVDEAIKIMSTGQKKISELKQALKPKKEAFQAIKNSLYAYQQKTEERQELSNLYYQLTKAGLQNNRGIMRIQKKAANKKIKELEKIEEKDLSWPNVKKAGGLPTISTYRLEGNEYKVIDAPRMPDVPYDTVVHLDAEMLQHFCSDVLQNIKPEHVENREMIDRQKVAEYMSRKGISREKAQEELELEEKGQSIEYRSYEKSVNDIEIIEEVLGENIPLDFTSDLSKKELGKLNGDRISAGIALRNFKECLETSFEQQRMIENMDKLLEDLSALSSSAMDSKQKAKLIAKVEKEKQKAIKRLIKAKGQVNQYKGNKYISRYLDNIEDCREFVNAKNRLNAPVFETNQDYNNALEVGQIVEGTPYTTKKMTEEEKTADEATISAFWSKEIAYARKDKSMLQLPKSTQVPNESRNQFMDNLKVDENTQSSDQSMDGADMHDRDSKTNSRNYEVNENDGQEPGDD